MLINYNNVNIYQGENLVLEGVKIQAHEGEFIYLIGKVGSGKTSLLKTFYGELDVRSGQADVLGMNMARIKRKHIQALRRQLGIVFQDFQLLTDRSVALNLDFVLRSTGWKKRKERDRRIQEVLQLVNMAEKAGHMPYELSGGEQQRICIARALLNRPKMILADEATGNLDYETGQHIATILHDICRSGTTVVMSTHNERLVRDFPGTVYRCADHQLVECSAEFDAGHPAPATAETEDLATETQEKEQEN